MKKAAVLMGSDSDLPVVTGAIEQLKAFGIPFEAHIMSAHRTPNDAGEFAKSARDNGFGVIIAAAGKSAALGGVIASFTTLPVIGIPLKSADFGGLDSLLSTVQMPPGVPVAAVAVDGAQNAAILAAEILAVHDEALAARLSEYKESMAEKIREKDSALCARINNEE